MRKPSGTTVVYVGYMFLLLGFVSLGLFVAALAFGSSLAAWAGIALVSSFAIAVAAFRAGSRGLANIWAESVTGTAVDRYTSTYRHDARADLPADDRPAPTQWSARAA
jgi:hypothetical protein